MMRQFLAVFVGTTVAVAMLTSEEARAQAQPKVAVYNFTDPQASGLAPQLSEMIRTAIVNSKKFTVISRDMTIAEEEAQLAKAGKTTRGARKTNAQVESVDFAIEGSITSAQLTQKKDFLGDAADKLFLGGKGIAGGCVAGTFSVSIDVRVKDLATGETPYADSLTRTLKSECSRSGGAVDFPVVMRSIADELAKEFATRIYPIKIIAVQPDGGLMLNYGDSVLQPGLFMKIFGPGEEVFSDGVMLKMDGPLLGRAKITDASPQTSRAVLEAEGVALPPVGSLLRFDENQEPARPQGRRRGR